jgi:drug/metabolite transporter (DMT)-like permease
MGGLFLSVLCASTAAIFIVSADAPPLSISFFRLLFTTLLITPVVIFSPKIRRELRTLPPTTFLIMTLIGVILAAHFLFWITSLTLTSVASSVILVTAHPILVGPLSHFFLRERLTFINSGGIILSMIGVGVLVYGNYGLTSFTLDTLEGNFLALMGGVAAALYIVGGRKIRKTLSVFTYAFVVYAIATLVLFILCLFSSAPLLSLSTKDYILIFFMALLAGIFGHTLYNWSLEYIRASLASVALLGEPVFSTLFAFMLPWIHQIPSKYTLIGGGIIFLGIYLCSREKEQRKPRHLEYTENTKPMK